LYVLAVAAVAVTPETVSFLVVAAAALVTKTTSL
jgi:hypothetical protein